LPTQLEPTTAQQSSGVAQGAVSSTEINLLMTEGKLHHNEVKTEFTKLFDKVESLQSKMVAMEASNKQLALQQAPDMETTIIMLIIITTTRVSKIAEKASVGVYF